MSPTIRHKYKYFHSTVQIAKNRRQKVEFCPLPFDVRPCNVKLNLSSHVLYAHVRRVMSNRTKRNCGAIAKA